jgi:glycosyltransferase involved in cell wall biosynthesis
MRLLFVKEALVWPRVSGHHVHTYYLLRALGQLGHTIALLTNAELDVKAVEGIALEHEFSFQKIFDIANVPDHRLTLRQRFFHKRWGIDKRFSKAVRWAADEFRAEAVITIGWKELAYLDMLVDPVRVWYVADDPVRYHLLQARQGKFFQNLRRTLSYTLFERAFRSRVDRAWVVTAEEKAALRWLGGIRADVVANGVDAEYFQACPEATVPRSCVFWGRLDFAPNIQALQWFCSHVWPLLRRDAADARFTIYGFKPTAAVQALAGRDGIEIMPDLPDLRTEVCRHQVVVLPFVGGGGIKNKLLEAASMAKAIVCSPETVTGLHLAAETPLTIAQHPEEWQRAVTALWGDPEQRRRLGQAARRWVTQHYDWQASARSAAASIESALQFKRARRKSAG